MKTALRRIFITSSAHIKNLERFQINDLIIYWKARRKQKKTSLRKRTQEEINKFNTKINEINEMKSSFLEKTSKIAKLSKIKTYHPNQEKLYMKR